MARQLRQRNLVLTVSNQKFKLNLERSVLAPKVNAGRCIASASEAPSNVTRASANAKTARMMIKSQLSRHAKPRRKYLRSHLKGRDAIVGRILASKTTAFATKLDLVASLAFANARTVSTTKVHLRCPKSLRMPVKSVFIRLKAGRSQSKNELRVDLDIMFPKANAINDRNLQIIDSLNSSGEKSCNS